MAKRFPKLATVGSIIKTAAKHQEGPLADYGFRSYPIPAPGDDGLRLQFLYGRTHAEGPGEPVWIATPEYLVTIDAENRRETEIRMFDPAEIGLAGPAWLGQDHSAERRKQADFAEQEAAMLAEFDLVLPGLAAGLQPLPDPARQAIPLLEARFRYLEHAPMAPFYDRLGAWFFRRLEELRP